MYRMALLQSGDCVASLDVGIPQVPQREHMGSRGRPFGDQRSGIDVIGWCAKRGAILSLVLILNCTD
jgi:hypothetical protein